MHACSVAQLCLTLCDPMDCSLPGSSMKFSRQEYWSGLPCPPPGDLPVPGMEPASPASLALTGGFFTTVPPGKPIWRLVNSNSLLIFFYDTTYYLRKCMRKKKSLNCGVTRKLGLPHNHSVVTWPRTRSYPASVFPVGIWVQYSSHPPWSFMTLGGGNWFESTL